MESGRTLLKVFLVWSALVSNKVIWKAISPNKAEKTVNSVYLNQFRHKIFLPPSAKKLYLQLPLNKTRERIRSSTKFTIKTTQHGSGTAPVQLDNLILLFKVEKKPSSCSCSQHLRWQV